MRYTTSRLALLLAEEDQPVWGGVDEFLHCRSRMTIDPRIPTMPVLSMSGFQRPRRQGCVRGGGLLFPSFRLMYG